MRPCLCTAAPALPIKTSQSRPSTSGQLDAWMHVRQTETPLPAPAQAGISWKARQAMKRSSPSHVHAIEVPILAFLQQVGEAGLPGME